MYVCEHMAVSVYKMERGDFNLKHFLNVCASRYICVDSFAALRT